MFALLNRDWDWDLKSQFLFKIKLPYEKIWELLLFCFALVISAYNGALTRVCFFLALLFVHVVDYIDDIRVTKTDVAAMLAAQYFLWLWEWAQTALCLVVCGAQWLDDKTIAFEELAVAAIFWIVCLPQLRHEQLLGEQHLLSPVTFRLSRSEIVCSRTLRLNHPRIASANSALIVQELRVSLNASNLPVLGFATVYLTLFCVKHWLLSHLDLSAAFIVAQTAHPLMNLFSGFAVRAVTLHGKVRWNDDAAGLVPLFFHKSVAVVTAVYLGLELLLIAGFAGRFVLDVVEGHILFH